MSIEAEPPMAAILVDFIDGQGRQWLAAGQLGPLTRMEDGNPVESLPAGRTKGKEMGIVSLLVVEEGA